MKKFQLLTALFLFFIFTGNAQYTKIYDMDDTLTGRNPDGTLLFDGTYLYGTTYSGAEYNRGAAIRIKPDGTGFSKLVDFDDTTGFGQSGMSFCSDGTYLYSSTFGGVATGLGRFFRMKLDGSSFDTLFTYDVTTDRGASTFISDGNFLYGGGGGGISGLGKLYSIRSDGTGFNKFLDFNGSGVSGKGSYPNDPLYYDGTFFYGTANAGGTSNFGTVYKVRPNGSSFQKLFDFNGTNGKSPICGLVSDGTYLYGTTYLGGTSSMGVVFKIKNDGTGYTKLIDFNGPNGAYPRNTLLTDGTYLYGTTQGGGANSLGTIFRMKLDGTFFSTLYSFDGPNGSSPCGSLISHANYLYGMALDGGADNVGAIFKFAYSPVCSANYSTSYDSTLNTFFLTIDPYTTSMAVSYHWDFGDGTTSTSVSPSHVYAIDSVYNVCMKIYTSSGDSCTYCHYIGKDYAGNVIRSGGFTLMVNNFITNVSSVADEEAGFLISPNPNSGVFSLRFEKSESQKGNVTVTNIIGEKVYYRHEENLANLEIDLSDRKSGIYILQVETENSVRTARVVINR